MHSLDEEFVTGDGRILNVGEIAQIYRNCVNFSEPKRGTIRSLGSNKFGLTCEFDTLDCDERRRVKTLLNYSLSTNKSTTDRSIKSVRCISDANEVVNGLSATSDDGRYRATLKISESDKEKQVLEIWDHARLLKSINIADSFTHGQINTDEHFSSFVWNGDKLLYVCQAKQPKSLSYFKPDEKAQADEKAKAGPGRGEIIHENDWGECLTDIRHTIVAVLDVGNNFHVTTISLDGHSLAAPQWLDNGTKIVSVAYNEEPRRLGIIYCNNRASKLLVHDWRSQKTVFEISSKKDCFHSPRVSNAGNKFIYLSNPIFGPHFHSNSINICDLKTGNSALLLNEIFLEDAPLHPFTSDDEHILFIRSDHLHTYLSLCNIADSKLTTIRFPIAGVSILDFRYDIILTSGSDINAFPTLFVAALNPRSIGDVVAWHQIKDCVIQDELSYEEHKIPTADGTTFLSAILVKPNLGIIRDHNPGKPSARRLLMTHELPTVVLPHGGPHLSFLSTYMLPSTFYAKLGMKTLFINYRGSTGVSEEYVESLIGRIGTQDVEDCLELLRHFKKTGEIDPSKLIIQGGSHGGFLACHLSCQEEFKFTCAMIRNPVVDLPSMLMTSDIPDWVWTESLGDKTFEFARMPTSQELVRMYECSPSSKVSKANVPTFMMVGSKDQRVNMHQGLRWIELLKAKGLDTRCKIYPDNHAMAKAETSTDAWISIAIWFLKHLP